MKKKRITKKMVKQLMYQAYKAGEAAGPPHGYPNNLYGMGAQNVRFAALHRLFPKVFTRKRGA